MRFPLLFCVSETASDALSSLVDGDAVLDVEPKRVAGVYHREELGLGLAVPKQFLNFLAGDPPLFGSRESGATVWVSIEVKGKESKCYAALTWLFRTRFWW